MKTKSQLVEAANTEEFTRKDAGGGKMYNFRLHTYGVLVPNPDHPLSCVSVSNDSLSIDLWTGCSWQCSYCHVQGTLQDIEPQGKMLDKPKHRSRFSIKEIIDQLVEHPFFTPHETIISVGTASTEPFAKDVASSTFDIMMEFVERGLRNPFWIITKAGIPKNRKQSFARIVQAGNPLMISICWANNPNTIEPVNNNRFENVEDAREAGAIISWHMRPIVKEWSGSQQNIEMMMLWVQRHYGGVIDSIVPGGLRWTEGIEYGLTEIHKLEMPKIPKKDNEKHFSTGLWKRIVELSRELFPTTPLYFKSSCCMSKMLKMPSINLVQYYNHGDCEESICPIEQRQRCASFDWRQVDRRALQAIFDGLHLNIAAIGIDGNNHRILSDPPLTDFTYAITQTCYKELARRGKK